MQTIPMVLTTIERLQRCLGLCGSVTGAGNVDDGGGGLECRFSLRLLREVPETVELVDAVEEMDRLVFRRSRILNNVCIKAYTR